MSRPLRRSLALAVALLAGAGALPPAFAQGSDPASIQLAQGLYDQAVKEMAARGYAAACAKLEEAVRLVPEGIGAKLTLAECYEADGRLASAWTAYALAEAAAARAGQADRAKLAADRASALKPRLATLTIAVGDPVKALPGLSITRDGVAVGSAQWGVPLPADKGKHTIVAAAADGRRWERAAVIEADGSTVTLALDEPPEKAAPPPPPAGDPVAPPEDRPSSTQRTAGLVVLGAGIAGLLGGIGAGVAAVLKKSASDSGQHCHGNVCDQTGFDLRTQSLAAGNASTALIVVGGAALAAGVITVALAPARKPATVSVSVGLKAISLSGTF